MDKGAQENKLVVGSQARILYADAEGRVKICFRFNQAIAKGDIGTIVLGRTITMFPEQTLTGNIKHLRRIAFYSRYGYSKRDWRQFPWRYLGIHSQWRRSRMGRGINGGFGMVLDGSKEALRRLQSMLLGCQ
jgi:urocanate hydratase